MAKKAATPATVTLKHLAAAIAEDQELSKKQAESILSDVVTMITKHLKKGERIRIVGLGILQVRKRAARMGRNPATGEAIHIKASKKTATKRPPGGGRFYFAWAWIVQRIAETSELVTTTGLPAFMTWVLWAVWVNSELLRAEIPKPATAIPATRATTTIFKWVARSAE